ncbi:MAG: low molecular weight phosphotyrosine protein phosphatase, partial [Cyanobacteria bacterium J06643_5]
DYCRNHSLKEVPDPYYGGTEGFNQVVNLLVDACEGLLEDISSDKLN